MSSYLFSWFFISSSELGHQWIFTELKRLYFDGSYDALAQYVETSIDNNREAENGDLELLEKQVNSDLIVFLR